MSEPAFFFNIMKAKRNTPAKDSRKIPQVEVHRTITSLVGAIKRLFEKRIQVRVTDSTNNALRKATEKTETLIKACTLSIPELLQVERELGKLNEHLRIFWDLTESIILQKFQELPLVQQIKVLKRIIPEANGLQLAHIMEQLFPELRLILILGVHVPDIHRLMTIREICLSLYIYDLNKFKEKEIKKARKLALTYLQAILAVDRVNIEIQLLVPEDPT